LLKQFFLNKKKSFKAYSFDFSDFVVVIDVSCTKLVVTQRRKKKIKKSWDVAIIERVHLFSGMVLMIFGAVVTIPGAVAIGNFNPILIFRCGFCRWEWGESFYGDDFLKGSVWWSKSISKKIGTTTLTTTKKKNRRERWRRFNRKIEMRFDGSKIKLEAFDLLARG
jgi:hypothetical protein